MKPHMIEELVRQAQQGDADAFKSLMDSCRSLVYHEAYRWLGDAHQAEDAVQDTFLAVYQHLRELRQPHKFVGWLRQIVRSQCNLQTRRKQHDMESIEADENFVAKTPTPENIVERRERADSIVEALNSLPEHERVVMEEFYLKGEKQTDIAEKLGIPVSTVKKRLQYARKKLKGMIDELSEVNPADLLPWLYPAWRKLRQHERQAAKICYLLFFADYANTLAYRQSDDESGNRHLDL